MTEETKKMLVSTLLSLEEEIETVDNKVAKARLKRKHTEISKILKRFKGE